jgi:prepilin peptidase CpaA
MTGQVWIAVILGLAASAEDLRRRNVSNWIPLSALVAGLAWQVSQTGWLGLAASAGGAVLGFLIFLLFYLLGGMGGGDVKLMAGFGSLLGAGRLLEAALWTAAIGGLLAVAALGWHELSRRMGRNRTKKMETIPYAPAITMGVWLSLVPR